MLAAVALVRYEDNAEVPTYPAGFDASYGVNPRAVVTLLDVISPRMVAELLFSTLPRPRLVLAADALARSDRLFAVSNAPVRDAYAASQTVPSYTFMPPPEAIELVL